MNLLSFISGFNISIFNFLQTSIASVASNQYGGQSVDTSHLGKYSVQSIGPRTKVINDKNVKAIYYKEVPNTLFVYSKEEKEKYIKKSNKLTKYKIILGGLYNVYRKYGTEKRKY